MVTGRKIENSLSIIIGICLCVYVLLWLDISVDLLVPIMKDFQNIGICVFGFLITTMSIIIQGNSETILKIKNNEIIYKRIISLNKRVVIISLIAAIYSLIFGNITITLNLSTGIYWRIISSIFCGIIVVFLLDLILFAKVFFYIIKK